MSFVRSLASAKGGRCTTSTGWEIDTAAILANGQAMFVALGGVAVVVMGIKLGLKVLRNVVHLF